MIVSVGSNVSLNGDVYSSKISACQYIIFEYFGMINRCIDKLKIFHNISTDEELRIILNLKRTTLNYWRKSKNIPGELIKHLNEHNLSLDEYLGPEGWQHLVAENCTPWTTASDWTCPDDSDQETDDLICKTRTVITSDTIYAGALKENIVAFYQAVESDIGKNAKSKKNAQ